jgi:hypothetical protein
MEQQGILRMELKYCERCGGLMLRACGSSVTYCGPCGRKMAELPLRGLRQKAAEARAC